MTATPVPGIADLPDTASTTGLIRAGILVLPLGGALKLIGNLGTFDSIGYGVPQPAEAVTVTGAGFMLGELAGSILPVLLAPFGVLALFAYLVGYGHRRTLTAALTRRFPNLREPRRALKRALRC